MYFFFFFGFILLELFEIKSTIENINVNQNFEFRNLLCKFDNIKD